MSRSEARSRDHDGGSLIPPVPKVILELDDNSPPEMPAFTHEASAWSMEHDFNLQSRTAAAIFRAIHEALDGSRFRSYPDQVARTTDEYFNGLVEPDEVTWLSGAELVAADSLLPTGESSIEKSLRMLFEVVAVVGRHFGQDRVRLVFAFS